MQPSSTKIRHLSMTSKLRSFTPRSMAGKAGSIVAAVVLLASCAANTAQSSSSQAVATTFQTLMTTSYPASLAPTSAPVPPSSSISSAVEKTTTSNVSTSVPVRGKFGTTSAPIPVQVTGLALSDGRTRQVVMCPPFGVAGVGSNSSLVPTPQCLQPIPVSGLDMQALASPNHNATNSWGQVHIQAVWNGVSLKVVSQRLPNSSDTDPFASPRLAVACPAPTGGWIPGALPANLNDGRIQKAAGPGFGGLAIGYPGGAPPVPNNGDLHGAIQVLVVGVTGDLPAAESRIRKVYKQNLCAVHAVNRGADVTQQTNKLNSPLIANDPSLKGLMDSFVTQFTLGNPQLVMHVIVDSPGLERMLSKLGGPGVLVDAWIKPTV